MPISHNHRCIFIHIPKTGGSSIEKALNFYAAVDPTGVAPQKDILLGKVNWGQHLQHMTLSELLDEGYVKPNEVKEYFKFTFVRNPWDRMVSEYFYARSYRRIPQNISFKEFVCSFVPSRMEANRQHFRRQSDFYEDGLGKDLLDFVGKYETIKSDYKKICEMINVPPVRLPHIRKREHYFYVDYYDVESRDVILNIYRKEIERFEYRFEKNKVVVRVIKRLTVDAKRCLRRISSQANKSESSSL